MTQASNQCWAVDRARLRLVVHQMMGLQLAHGAWHGHRGRRAQVEAVRGACRMVLAWGLHGACMVLAWGLHGVRVCQASHGSHGRVVITLCSHGACMG